MFAYLKVENNFIKNPKVKTEKCEALKNIQGQLSSIGNNNNKKFLNIH